MVARKRTSGVGELLLAAATGAVGIESGEVQFLRCCLFLMDYDDAPLGLQANGWKMTKGG